MRDLLLGSLGGLIVGGAAVLLTTPRSGKENRERLTTYASDVKSSSIDASNKAKHTQAKLKDLQFEIAKVQGPFLNEIKGITSDFQLEMEPRLRRIKERQTKLQADVNDLSNRM